MFGNGKIENSSVWKRQNLEFQCLEKDKTENSNVWKRQNLEFQCLETAKLRIPMFGKGKI